MPKEYEVPKPAEPDPPVEPAPVEDPKPDLDALLATERAKTEEAQKALEKNQLTYDARMQQLETMLQDKFSAKTPPPGETPVATPVTAEDFLTPEGAAEATRRIAAEAANEMGRNIDANYGNTLAQTRAAQFDLKYEGLKSRKYFKHVEEKLEQALTQNPKLRYAPEALDILYNNLVGGSMDEILEAAVSEAPTGDPKLVHPKLEAPRGGPAPPSGPAPTPPADPTQLTAAEERIRSKFAPFLERMSGKPYSAEHYAKSRDERSGREPIPVMEETNAR